MQERMERLIEQAELPFGLRKVNPEFVTKGVQEICNNMFATTGMIYLHGLGLGKSTNAAALLMSYIHGYADCEAVTDIGLYVNAYELCYQNSTRSRYQPNMWLSDHIERIRVCKCVVIDNLFATTTQQDDLLLQSIFDMRQYYDGVTIYTSGVRNAFDSASRVLQRIERSAKYKEEFL